MTEPIRGKVARVLNEREIAINLGRANGVTVGMYFDVIHPKGLEIEDPDTGEPLGSIDLPKVRVRVMEAKEKLSVATIYRKKKVNVGGTGGLSPLGPFARSLMPPEWVTKYETLHKTGETPESLNEEDSAVKTGDPVKQVLEVDEAEQENTNEK